MTGNSRIRQARALIASITAAGALLAAGCSSGDAPGLKQGDKKADGPLAPGFADVTLTPKTPLEANRLAAAADVIRNRAESTELPVRNVTVRDGAVVVRVALDKYGRDTRNRVAPLARHGQLTLRPVGAVAASGTGAGGLVTPAGVVPAESADAFAALDCANTAVSRVDTPTEVLLGCDAKLGEKYVLAPAVMTGADITEAKASLSDQGVAGWEIVLKWTEQGQRTFTETTARLSRGQLPTDRFAIVWDGDVLSAPTVRSEIPGDAVISGDFTNSSAHELAGTIDAGALPGPFAITAYVEGGG